MKHPALKHKTCVNYPRSLVHVMVMLNSFGMTRTMMLASHSIMEAARVMVTSLTPWSSVRTDAERELGTGDTTDAREGTR